MDDNPGGREEKGSSEDPQGEETAGGSTGNCCNKTRDPSVPTLVSCLPFRLAAVRTVYCMSEAEMVAVALGTLIEARKQEKPLEPPTLVGAGKQQLSPTCSTLSPSSPGSGSEDEGNGKDALPPGLGPPRGCTGSEPACSRSPEDDDDMLKYVREIFFS
ncbi:PREDICTED: modulator of retrovirus infection homolog [Odobenus rosmarus divergens]|uniref:Modulator of retrovirus infection homolog n=1 Tax=Odobenus rosmarus divergens TaxID=9708 RepID=A0A9B0GVU5_ODORO